MGRAYICGLSPPEREILLDRIRQRGHAAWPKLKKGIERAILSVARSGFCISTDWRSDVIGVGAPVVTAHGAVFAINCGGHPAELSLARAEEDVGPRLARAAALIERA
jgi:DNA-binding IclR family transcriptional regulator